MKNFFKNIAFISFLVHIAGNMIFGSLYFPGIFLSIALVSAILSLIFGMTEKQQKTETKKKTTKQNNSDTQLMNQLVNEFFSTNESYPLANGIYLQRTNVNSFDGLDVVCNGETICKMGEFIKFNPETYESIRIRFKNGVGGNVVTNGDVVKKEETQIPAGKSELETTIETIQKHMEKIENKTITDELSKTSMMLQSIDLMVKRAPNKEGKLDKLKSFYLPSLLTILENYNYLYTTNKYDPSIPTVEAKLSGTLALINEALASIRDSMNDAEILDINADMSVIESMLQQDGLVKKGSIDELK